MNRQKWRQVVCTNLSEMFRVGGPGDVECAWANKTTISRDVGERGTADGRRRTRNDWTRLVAEGIRPDRKKCRSRRLRPNQRPGVRTIRVGGKKEAGQTRSGRKDRSGRGKIEESSKLRPAGGTSSVMEAVAVWLEGGRGPNAGGC